MESRKWMSDVGGEGGGDDKDAQDYLSKLAKSILSKDRSKSRPAPPGGNVSSPAVPLPPSGTTSSREVQRDPRPTPATMPGAGHPPGPRRSEVSREWVRKVEFYDENGHFLPGTILVFEDGSMGVYKETNPVKEYDIVYQLMDTGRAVPQGIPLYNYEVEAVGRLSELHLSQLVGSNRWDRDMIVFHLVKYKDIAYIPKLIDGTSQASGSGVHALPSLEGRSSATVQRPGEALLRSEGAVSVAHEAEKPRETRGRRLTIDFGPNRSWDAVYWGKDELGHVVAHHTHEKWSLMHLDLNRFKDSIVWSDMVTDEKLQAMEKDIVGRG